MDERERIAIKLIREKIRVNTNEKERAKRERKNSENG